MSDEKPRIMVGIPCYGTMPAPTEEDYLRLMYYLGRRYTEYDFFLAIRRKSEQFRARNSIVEAAYQVAANWLWMLDDDQVIDTDDANGPTTRYEILRRMLGRFDEKPDAGIVGALYYHRGGECRPVVMRRNGEAYAYLRDDEITHGLQPVAVTGGGCMLIKMGVFDKIGVAPFHPEHQYGTDIQVCQAAIDAGFGVYCDTSLKIGHVKQSQAIVTEANRHEHYEQTQNTQDTIAT